MNWVLVIEIISISLIVLCGSLIFHIYLYKDKYTSANKAMVNVIADNHELSTLLKNEHAKRQTNENNSKQGLCFPKHPQQAHKNNTLKVESLVKPFNKGSPIVLSDSVLNAVRNPGGGKL